MYLYTASPEVNEDEDVEPFSFTVATSVCSDLPVKFAVRGKNRFTHALALDMNDKDLALLIKLAQEAQEKRNAMKIVALENLVRSEYDAGTLSMEAAERMQYLASAVLADEENLSISLTDSDLEDES